MCRPVDAFFPAREKGHHGQHYDVQGPLRVLVHEPSVLEIVPGVREGSFFLQLCSCFFSFAHFSSFFPSFSPFHSPLFSLPSYFYFPDIRTFPQVPTVVKRAKAALAKGQSVVIGLQKTVTFIVATHFDFSLHPKPSSPTSSS
jgi:hypothetical protein